MTTDNNISFNAYLKSRDQNPEELLNKLKIDGNGKQKPTYENDDPRLFKYKLDKTETALVLMRFLPQKNLQTLPVLHRFSHSFQNPDTGRWFIEQCPTIDGFEGDPCPMCAQNSIYFNDNGPDKGELRRKIGADNAKSIGIKRSRRKEHVSCVYILQDSTNPENNGKVLIWVYGEEVYRKICAALKPDEKEIAVGGKKPIPVFDLFNGANFVLSLCKVKGQVNYDKCSFQSPSALFGGDEAKIKEVWDQIIDVNEFDPHKLLRSREELYARYDYVMGVTNSWKGKPSSEQKQEKKEEKTPVKETVQKQEVKEEKKPESAPATTQSNDVDVTDDMVEEMFK